MGDKNSHFITEINTHEDTILLDHTHAFYSPELECRQEAYLILETNFQCQSTVTMFQIVALLWQISDWSC